MKFSRFFFLTVLILLFVTGGAYYYVTHLFVITPVELKQLDKYTQEHFNFFLDLDPYVEEATRIYCDPGVATTTTEEVTISYPCQNENPMYRVMIGWGDEGYTYKDLVQLLGNEMLYIKNYTTDENDDADAKCFTRSDASSYRGVHYGADCRFVTAKGQKLSMSVFFFEPHNSITPFVAVMNTRKNSSPQNVELELLRLVSKLKISTTKSILLSFFDKSSAAGLDSFETNSSSIIAIEKNAYPRSGATTEITQSSGNGIDATVCSAVDVSQCFPMYCSSLSAVWSYTFNKCVEPVVEEASPLSGGKNCSGETPVWDGSKCRSLSGTILSSNTCFIEDNQSSCNMDVIWNVEKPEGEVTIKQPLTSTSSLLLAQGKSGSLSQVFSYNPTPYVIELYEGTQKSVEATFTTQCARGGWSMELQKCINPKVSEVNLLGEYYRTPGEMKFTCEAANMFSVQHGDTGVMVATGTYLGQTIVPLIKSGNYTLTCLYNSIKGLPVIRYYHAPPAPPAEVSLSLTPRAVMKDEPLLMIWNITHPKNTCTLSAKVVCRNNVCSQTQRDYEKKLNEQLVNESTDQDDTEGSRVIQEALTTIAPSRVDTDWRATGKKTLTITNTVDFTLACGEIVDKKRVYFKTEP